MKVLVFCQRKKSLDVDAEKVEYVVREIENFISKKYYPLNITFEYLTEGIYGKPSLFDADHKLLFDVFNKDENIKQNSIKFMKDHKEYYDMILLQTCPLLLVEKQLPYLFETLKIGGKILFTSFTYEKTKYQDEELNNIIPYKDIYVFIGGLLEQSFNIIEFDKYYSEYEMHTHPLKLNKTD